VTERSLPQGTLTCFIPGGHVRPFVQYANFSDRTESVTKNMYKKIGIHDYIIIVQLGKSSDRTKSATRNVNMFIPAGHVRPLVPLGKFSDRPESATRHADLLSPKGNLVTERTLSPKTCTER